MARNTTSGKRPDKASDKKLPSENRGLMLALAGFTALLILVVAAVAIFSTINTGQSAQNDQNFTPSRQGLLSIGSQAPNFTVKTIDGGNASLGGKNKSATLLVLFASWCPHCQAEAPTISSLEKKYPDLRVMMVSIPDVKTGWEQGDDPQNVRKFVNTYDIKGPAAYDPAVGREYKVSGTPTIYVLDKNDKIVASNSGETPAGVLEGWIQKALG